MNKTFVTNMPNHIGAFLQASRALGALGVNITRVSYNKAVDSHTLFIDASGTGEQLLRAEKELTAIGYLREKRTGPRVLLLEFRLPDVPGGVTAVLELIEEFGFNISYLSSRESGRDYQLFTMGLLVEDGGRVSDFIRQAEGLCPVRVVEYNPSEKVFDNSIFYDSFADSLVKASGIDPSAREELVVNVNLAMQILAEQGQSPYRTFDSISRFADLLVGCRGEAFSPRISRHALSEETELILIEPPCGSNTAILRHGEETLFIDTGYAYYRKEMTEIFRRLLPDFDTMRKTVLITHADVDHCGLLPLFDEIIASRKSAESLRLEYEGKEAFREQNPLHRPYIRICKTLTEYRPPRPEQLRCPWRTEEPEDEILWQIGFFRFGDLNFEVYQCRGGHLPGEIVLVDYEHHVCFTGDVYVNIKGMTSEQRLYNSYAPILMTSVDTDPELCARQREAVFRRLGRGDWQVFGAHGMKKDLSVQ